MERAEVAVLKVDEELAGLDSGMDPFEVAGGETERFASGHGEPAGISAPLLLDKGGIGRRAMKSCVAGDLDEAKLRRRGKQHDDILDVRLGHPIEVDGVLDEVGEADVVEGAG